MKRDIVNDLEYAVLEKFCEQRRSPCPPKGEFLVKDRARNSVGFLTELEPNDATKQLSSSTRVYDLIPDARTVSDGAYVGFLLYFNENGLDAIEGYVYSDAWPAAEWPVEFENKQSGR